MTADSLPVPPIPSLSMEPLSKASHGPHSLLFKHLLSTLLEVLRLSTLALVISLEAILVLQKWKPIFHFLLLSIFVFISIIEPYFRSSTPVYLVDFSCFKPPNFCKVPPSFFLENASKLGYFDKESVAFMAKILTSSGLGEETYLPPALHCIPPKSHQQESIKEAEMVLLPIMEDLLCKTKISPQDIDILIVSCSGFCPSPSLSSIIINKFSMRDDVRSFSLSGMGCGAGAIAIDMAQNLLKILPPLEKFWHGVSTIRKRFFEKSREIYVPNFKSVIQHFCLPTSGRALIREVAKGLKLGENEDEAALMTLHRFGNQSSSSLWYELAYMEAKGMVKKGDKMWVLGMGTGPKCCSLVWECLRPIVDESIKGPWADSIDRYPITP
ncbi:hypothetical protein D5086_027540 [Populus alba]|uniref:Uncharacterized protein n=1 Tax=Populus alba TaxID=43335 RepID=A0ACC4AWG3_POPAL